MIAGEAKVTEFSDLRDMYQVHIDYIRHENDLLNQRTTWFLAIQSLLLAGTGYLVLNYFESAALAAIGRPDEPILKTVEFGIEAFFICVFGLISSNSAEQSIMAAFKAQRRIDAHWRAVCDSHLPDPSTSPFPGLLGGGSRKIGKDGNKLAMHTVLHFKHFWIFFGWCISILTYTIAINVIIDPEAYRRDTKPLSLTVEVPETTPAAAD